MYVGEYGVRYKHVVVYEKISDMLIHGQESIVRQVGGGAKKIVFRM